MGSNIVRIILAIAVAALIVLGLVWLFGGFSGDATPTQEAVLCPEATPEYFDVYSLTSPTDATSQVVSAELGNGEVITITTESGTFVAPVTTFPTEITVDLLPNTTHNLTVEGRVREIQQGECSYGGYTLTTTRDRDGQPLVIEQRGP